MPSIPSSSITKFYMASPPVGWTKITTGINDCALRVTSGTVVGGGSTPFSTTFVSKTATGVRNMTLATDTNYAGAGSHQHASGVRSVVTQNSNAAGPSYVHPPTLPAPSQSVFTAPGFPGSYNQPAGGGAGHSHTLAVPGSINGPMTGATKNFAVSYLDVILGQRN